MPAPGSRWLLLLSAAVAAPLAAAIVPTSWCASAPPSTWPVCDESLGLDQRSADIVSRLSFADKMSALSVMNNDLPLPSINLPPHNWWSEATHGIHGVNNSAPTPWSSNTIFPITASCAFNRSLWAATGNVIGRDARAFMNVGHADSTFWAPVINIVRDVSIPRFALPPRPSACINGALTALVNVPLSAAALG